MARGKGRDREPGAEDDPRKSLMALRERLAARPVVPVPTRSRPARATPAPAPPVEPDDPRPPEVVFEAAMTDMRVAQVEPVAVPPRPPLPDEAPRSAPLMQPRSKQDQGAGPDARAFPVLDLHGMTEGDALSEARRFIELHARTGTRRVRVISGRGLHGGGEPVLRTALIAWLERSALVVAWRYGVPREGGDGVVVVTLRRG